MRTLTTIALLLLIVGGLNWLAVGAAQVDLVALLFGGQDSPLARIVYVLVGISALIVLFALPRLMADYRHPMGEVPHTRP